MKPIAEPVGMEETPDNHFRFGVLPFDPAHIVTAGGFIVYIGHKVKVSSFAKATEDKALLL